MFEELTAFLPRLKDKPFGEWHGGIERNQHGEIGWIQFPWVDYTQTVCDFIETVDRFVESHEDMGLKQYAEVFGKVGIKWDVESMSKADVSQLDGTTIAALIVGAYRAERFCDGALLGFLENGSINRWLERLLQIDEANDE